jgi:two-component system, NtrC family, response regulator AtoC
MNSQRIFLVEDDEFLVLMLTRALEDMGYQVQAETKAFGAIVEKIGFWSPHVVLLDLKLPGSNGIEILKEIRKSKVNTEVVILTGDDSRETREKCMNLGAVEYVTKPFDMEELRVVIEKSAGRKSPEHDSDYQRGSEFEGMRGQLFPGQAT